MSREFMSLPSARTEQLYVSRSVRNGLETLAQLHLASLPEGSEGPSIAATADGIADEILREHLDGVPAVVEKRRAIRRALQEIDRELTPP